MMILLECAGWGVIGCAASSAGKTATKAAIRVVKNGPLEDLKDSTLQAVDKFATSLGTMWMKVPTPQLRGDSTGGVEAGSMGSTGVEYILGYMVWVGLAIAVLSLIAIGVTMARRSRDGAGHVSRLTVVLLGVMLIGAASSITGALLPQESVRAAAPVALIQNSLWWYTAALVILSIVVAGIRMAWTHRAEPGKELIGSLMKMVVISSGAAWLVSLLVSAADDLANFMLRASLDCDPGKDAACFGDNLNKLLGVLYLGQVAGPVMPVGQLGVMTVLILAVVSALVTLAQCILMLARGGMLVALVGILPMSAAATNTEMGRDWFKKLSGWLLAFILYKPAAAIIYAVAFQLSGTNLTKGDKTGISSVLMGLVMMVMALVALPALMKTLVPASAPAAGGGGGLGGAAAGAALMALPTGAANLMGHRSSSDSQSQSTTSQQNQSESTTSNPPGASNQTSGQQGGRQSPPGGKPAASVPQAVLSAAEQAGHQAHDAAGQLGEEAANPPGGPSPQGPSGGGGGSGWGDQPSPWAPPTDDRPPADDGPSGSQTPRGDE